MHLSNSERALKILSLSDREVNLLVAQRTGFRNSFCKSLRMGDLLPRCNHANLYVYKFWKCRHLHRFSSWKIAVEILCINLVHL